MTKYLVSAPQPVTEKVCGVAFADGKATVDSETSRAALAYFRRRGYSVQEVADGRKARSRKPAPELTQTPGSGEQPSTGDDPTKEG